MSELHQQINEWQRATFPEATAKATLAHLSEELKKEMDGTEAPDEAADCYFLVVQWAQKAGIEYTSRRAIDGMAQATRKLLLYRFGKEDDSRKVNLSIEEIRRLLDTCTPDRFRTFILTMMFASADRGVLLKVRKRDLEIWHEPTENGDGRFVGKIDLDDRKATSRSRTVGLSHIVARALADQAMKLAPEDLVFGYGYHYVGKRWRMIREKAGLPDLRMKDLRHVFAGLSLDTAGISLAALKGGMGHTRLSTTMRYADRDVAFDSEHARLIEKAVFGETA